MIHTLSPAFHAKTLRLYADLMLAKREFKRAIRYYRHSCRDMGVVTNEQELETKLKVARYYVQLDSIHEAIQVNKAKESYTMALRQNPYALEAALALTKLAVAEDACLTIAGSDSAHGAKKRSARFTGSTTSGVSQHEIEKFYQTTATIGEIEDSELSPRLGVTWMQTLSFKFLDRVFPTNLHCLLHKAALEIGQEQLHQAHATFKRKEQIDDLNISFMDHYGNCLRKENLRTELSDLVQQLFSITSTCPESWLAAAYYSDMNEDYETALQYCEHAIEERNDHEPAH
ncbi:hypothetical protein PsorP6_009237 [Peronosclerospora sorghi]|uniref:Uncharacterized protein n=1 Tax=Peronosclerospora sorghi TaxID=230839 RepID=A0ACC0VZZ7_9STRA|nr:hypothetical protein PsorP6_009237 [Peronosclerospora sorghi]